MGSESGFGPPADSADADRTVEIIASDALDPMEVTVPLGE